MDNRLFDALERDEVRYARRTSDRGVPYAGFRWIDPPTASELALTAILEQDVLRITVHEIPTAADLASVSRSTRALPLGAIYISPDSGHVELSLAIYVGAAADLSNVVMELLRYAVAACAHLEGRLATPSLPAITQGLAHHGSDVAPVLAQRGYKPAPVEDGAKVEFPIDASILISTEVQGRPDGWFAAHAQYSSSALRVLDNDNRMLLQKLQRWTLAGRFLLDESGELRAEVLTPHLGQPSTEELIGWTVDQAAVMMQVAAKHLHIGQ